MLLLQMSLQEGFEGKSFEIQAIFTERDPNTI